MDISQKFVNTFKKKDYKKAYKLFNKWNADTQSKNIDNYEEYVKISTEIFNNLDKYTEEELVHKANVAANMMQTFYVENLCLLALIKNPKNPEIFYIWAKFALAYDYLWEAKDVIEQVFDLDPPEDKTKYLRLYARILSEIYTNKELEETDKAKYKKIILEQWESAIKLEPDNVENYLGLTLYYTLDYNDTDNDALMKAWDKVIELEPENGWFYSARAEGKSLIGDYNGAIEDYKKAIELGDIDYTTYRELANNYAYNNRKEKALELYQNAVNEHENNPELQKEMYIGLAAVNVWLFNYAKAEEIYTQLIEKYPDDLRLYSMRADIRYYTKKYEQGIEDADFVLSRNDPDYITTNLSKSNCLYELKRHEEAIKCCDIVIEAYPDYYAPYVNKCLSLYDMQKYEEALDFIKKAIELNPDYSDGWAQSGCIKFYLKDFEGAFKDVDKALEIDPKNLHANRIKGSFYYILGDTEKALNEINLAIEINKGLSYSAEEQYFLRHKIYKQQGKDAEAQADYDKTFELNPNFDVEEFEKSLKLDD